VLQSDSNHALASADTRYKDALESIDVSYKEALECADEHKNRELDSMATSQQRALEDVHETYQQTLETHAKIHRDALDIIDCADQTALKTSIEEVYKQALESVNEWLHLIHIAHSRTVVPSVINYARTFMKVSRNRGCTSVIVY
jgi:DNA anti-recombination protein RmuC